MARVTRPLAHPPWLASGGWVLRSTAIAGGLLAVAATALVVTVVSPTPRHVMISIGLGVVLYTLRNRLGPK